MSYSLRLAEPPDEAFIAEMLAEALDWRPGTPVRGGAAALADPALARYVVDWGQWPGDLGVIAQLAGANPHPTGGVTAQAAGTDRHSTGEFVPVGAAWLRFHPAGAPGYGFVDEQTPELGVGVIAAHRGRGLGTALIERLLADARAQGIAAVSLSVERANPAARLYGRLGFVAVAAVGDADTMVRRLT